MLPGLDAAAFLDTLRRERRAIVVRVGGEERWIAADDAGLYRDAVGVVPPGGLPDAFLQAPERPLEELLRRYARTHGPFTTEEARARYGVDVSSPLAALEAAGDLVRGELRPDPAAPGREWCDPDVLRRIRRASLAVLRQEIEAVDRGALATFLPGWQGVDRHPPAGAGIDRLREALVPLQGLALPADVWERDVLPRRVGAYSPGLDGPAHRERRGGVGRRRRARAQQRARGALLPRRRRRDRAAGDARARARAAARSPSTRPSASGCSPRRASSPTCSPRSARAPPRSCRRACGTSSGRAR